MIRCLIVCVLGWLCSAAQVPYSAKDFSALYGMPGFSEPLIKMHLQLYEGYVNNVNLYLDRLQEMAKTDGGVTTIEYAALKYRFIWEWDGMRLHEYYFENLKGKGVLSEKTALYQELVQQFGSYEAWKAAFVATGMMRGVGWVILYRDPQTARLINVWINEHDVGHLAGGSPLLVMDVFEHAYITEYGLNKGKYIEAFFANINWDVVGARFEKSAKPVP